LWWPTASIKAASEWSGRFSHLHSVLYRLAQSAACGYGLESEYIFTGVIDSLEVVNWPARAMVDGVERVLEREQDGCHAAFPALRIHLRGIESFRGKLEAEETVIIDSDRFEYWQPSFGGPAFDGFLEPGSLIGMAGNRNGDDLFMIPIRMFTIDEGRIINQEPGYGTCITHTLLDVATVEEMRQQLESCEPPDTRSVVIPTVVPVAHCPPAERPAGFCDTNAECGPGTRCNASRNVCESAP
jgi:hypothetical protein